MCLAAENDVSLLDINVDQNCIQYTDLPDRPGLRLIHGDVRDEDAVRTAMADCNIVIHLASLLGVQNVIDHARETIDTIVLGTRNVLNAASGHGAIERLVNVSTSEIYGNVANSGDDLPASIDTNNDPRMSYCAAKLLGEHLTWAYYRDFDLPAVNIRPFNIYGPLRTTSHAVGTFIVRALAGKELQIHGDGSQIRSWCYIDDFCDAVLACLHRGEAVGQHFNIGNARTTATIYDLAQRIVRLTTSNAQLKLVPRPFSDINVRVPHAQKASELLDYRPRQDMDDGLRPSIQWYRDHLRDFQHWL